MRKTTLALYAGAYLMLSATALVLYGATPAKPAIALDGEATCGEGQLTVLFSGSLASGDWRAFQAWPAFARTHQAHTSTEGAWLQDLSGSTGATRIFHWGVHEVIVASACPLLRCDEERALVAFDLATGDYGATVHDGPVRREILDGRDPELVVHAAPIRAALACAIQAGF